MFWLNLVILIVLIAGHTELLVMLVNRIHSVPIQHEKLEHARHAHDLMIVAFPPVLLWFVGVRGPAVLLGGSWSELPWPWAVYLALCACGAVGLLFSAVRWLSTTSPAAQISNHSEIVDIEQRLGGRPLGDGPFRWLTHVPGNEIFRLQVSDKVSTPPRLPREWDGLSILHLSDLHFYGTLDRPFFEEVTTIAAEMQPDLIAFTGDLLDKQELLDWLPSTLGKLSAPLGCYFILGNHDWYLDPDEIRKKVSALGWHDVAGRTITIEHNGRTLAIGGTEVPWMGSHPDWPGVPQDAFRLLLSHTPDHIGWARRQQVDLMLSGHNHGGQVVLPVFGPVYAPSRYGTRYAGGVFWQDPTLLYVSRGISGRHPLRLGCPPELTKLVLKAR